MKKLSKIIESIWSDIQDRSSGETIRKEDDVNLLDAQGFVEYLRDIYKNVDTEFYIYKDLNDMITVPTFETELGTKSTWFIEYDCNKKAVYIWEHFLNKEDKLFDKLNDNYKLTLIRRNFTENFLVEPKKGKSSNKFFIEIIDYILENASVFCKRILVKNNKVTESIWSDIQDRSSGEITRKEDDVNNLDRDGFFDYLDNRYSQVRIIMKTKEPYGIYVPLFKPDPSSLINVSLHINYPNDPTTPQIRLESFLLKYIHQIGKLLRDTFYVVDIPKKTNLDSDYIEIYPNENEPASNSFCLKVIDFLLYEAEKENKFIDLNKI